MGNFGRGAADAEKAAKELRPVFDRTEYFKLDDGEEIIGRFVHDGNEWYYVKVHQYVPTKPADPSWDEDKRYSERTSAVCRKDKAFDYEDCFICDELHKTVPNEKNKTGRWYPAIRYYVPLLLREAVRGTQELIDQGKIPATMKVRGEDVSTIDRVVGYTDQTVEVQETDAEGEPTGKVTTKPRVVLVNLGYDNFFGPLQGIYEVPNDDEDLTILDRDFRIRRKGTGTETKYHFKDMRATPGFDLRDPATREKYDIIDVEAIMNKGASDDHYAWYFDTRVDRPVREDKEKDGEKSGGKKPAARKPAAAKTAPKAQQEKPAETESDEETPDVAASLASLKSRMTRSHGTKAAEPEKEAAPDPEPAEEEKQLAPVGGGAPDDGDDDPDFSANL